MYMPLCVRESGVVRWHLSEGAALKPGDRLATLELDDPTAVTMAEVRAMTPRLLAPDRLLLIGCFAVFDIDGSAFDWLLRCIRCRCAFLYWLPSGWLVLSGLVGCFCSLARLLVSFPVCSCMAHPFTRSQVGLCCLCNAGLAYRVDLSLLSTRAGTVSVARMRPRDAFRFICFCGAGQSTH